jgi:hypothetical protein
MRTFAALLLKEESAIFTSPIAYVVLSVFLVIMGYTFTLTLFVSHVPTLVHLFFQIYVLFLLTVPIITMRLVAEERRLRTIEISDADAGVLRTLRPRDRYRLCTRRRCSRRAPGVWKRIDSSLINPA